MPFFLCQRHSTFWLIDIWLTNRLRFSSRFSPSATCSIMSRQTVMNRSWTSDINSTCLSPASKSRRAMRRRGFAVSRSCRSRKLLKNARRLAAKPTSCAILAANAFRITMLETIDKNRTMTASIAGPVCKSVLGKRNNRRKAGLTTKRCASLARSAWLLLPSVSRIKNRVVPALVKTPLTPGYERAEECELTF